MQKKQRPPFTWHYYAMALGALAFALAASLGAWSAAAAAFGFTVISFPALKFSGLTRQVILILFVIMYVFAFPAKIDPKTVETAPQAPLNQPAAQE